MCRNLDVRFVARDAFAGVFGRSRATQMLTVLFALVLFLKAVPSHAETLKGWVLRGQTAFPIEVTRGPNNQATITPGEWGTIGGHYEDGQQTVMYFKDANTFSSPLKSAWYGRINAAGDWQGVVRIGEEPGFPWYLKGPNSTTLEPPKTYGPAETVPSSLRFYGFEKPLGTACPTLSDILHDVVFSYELQQIGSITIPDPRPGLPAQQGRFGTLTYPAGAKQLLVFDLPGQRVYGLVVEVIADPSPGTGKTFRLTGIGYNFALGNSDALRELQITVHQP